MKKRFYIARFMPHFYYPNIERRYIADNSLKLNSQTALYMMIISASMASFVVADLALLTHSESKLISIASKTVGLIIAMLCYLAIMKDPKNYTRLFIVSNIAFMAFIANIVIITGIYHIDPISLFPPTVFEALVPYLISMLLIGILPTTKVYIQFSYLIILLLGYFLEVYLYYNFRSPMLAHSITYLGMILILSSMVAFSLHRYKRLMWARAYDSQLHIKQINRQKQELVSLNEKLKKISMIDELTGISNRRCFNDELRDASELYKRNRHDFSLFIIDIDHFKKVNDQYGHPVGDQVLRHISNVLSYSIRNTDKLFRIGGEEFAIISFDTSGEHNSTLALRIQNNLKENAITLEGHRFDMTVSQGICSAFEASKNLDDIYALADKALYQAKIKRNTFEIWDL